MTAALQKQITDTTAIPHSGNRFDALDKLETAAAEQQQQETTRAITKKHEVSRINAGWDFHMLHLTAINGGILLVFAMGAGFTLAGLATGGAVALLYDAHILTKTGKSLWAERQARKCAEAEAKAKSAQLELVEKAKPHDLWENPNAGHKLEQMGYDKDKMIAVYDDKLNKAVKNGLTLQAKLVFKKMKIALKTKASSAPSPK